MGVALKAKKDQCAEDNHKPSVIMNRIVDVRQPMPLTGGVGLCPQSAVHGMWMPKNCN